MITTHDCPSPFSDEFILNAQIAIQNRNDFIESNRSELRSQSACKIATQIASKSVGKWVDIATVIAMIRIAVISNC